LPPEKPPVPRGAKAPLPVVEEGQELRFVERLRRMGKWPLQRGPKKPRRAALTPFLVLKAATGDNGARPLMNDQEAFYNENVQILDVFGGKVTVLEKGKSYTLTCQVTNLGNLGAFGGIAEFYIAHPAVVDGLASMPKPILAARGYEGFTVNPGQTVTVTARRVWTPATDQEAISTIVVHAHDTFTDPVTRRFDARNDRHVGRRDTIPDFRGVWNGTVTAHGGAVGTWNLRLEITQAYDNVTVAIYLWQNTTPSTPQATVSTLVAGGKIVFTATGVTPVSSAWVLERQGTNHLKVGFSYPRDFIANGILLR
jgi:hypothetical protein